MSSLEKIKHQIRQFAVEREWDQFHSPKNLSMALVVEAAELVENFQWMTEDQSRTPTADRLCDIESEIADIQIYLVRLADKLDIDLMAAVEKKMAINASKYPAERVRGSSKKYTEYK